MGATSKPRYRIPVVLVDAEVSLDEFDENDIVEYLRHHGYTVIGGSSTTNSVDEQITATELDHIFTLSVCGQKDEARSEALNMIGRVIGRPI